MTGVPSVIPALLSALQASQDVRASALLLGAEAAVRRCLPAANAEHLPGLGAAPGQATAGGPAAASANAAAAPMRAATLAVQYSAARAIRAAQDDGAVATQVRQAMKRAEDGLRSALGR